MTEYKLPSIFFIFEQHGDSIPVSRGYRLTKESADAYCKLADYIPKNSRWFNVEYRAVSND